jgi:hypothetical protein
MKVSVLMAVLLATVVACSPSGRRGIADKRTNFAQFLPMQSDPAREGLKPVKPYFRAANRSEILRAIERACQGGKSGSSVFEAESSRGYYVNCNPENRQLLNGYVSSNPRQQPHSR